MTPTDNTPDIRRGIRIPITYLIQGIVIVVSLGIGYGGYRSAFENQGVEVQSARQEIVALRQDLNQLRLELTQVRQSLDDLKDSIDHDHKH